MQSLFCDATHGMVCLVVGEAFNATLTTVKKQRLLTAHRTSLSVDVVPMMREQLDERYSTIISLGNVVIQDESKIQVGGTLDVACSSPIFGVLRPGKFEVLVVSKTALLGSPGFIDFVYLESKLP